eukprot:1160626-Pelagomonas_calceolata.AAC.3
MLELSHPKGVIKDGSIQARTSSKAQASLLDREPFFMHVAGPGLCSLFFPLHPGVHLLCQKAASQALRWKLISGGSCTASPCIFLLFALYGAEDLQRKSWASELIRIVVP